MAAVLRVFIYVNGVWLLNQLQKPLFFEMTESRTNSLKTFTQLLFKICTSSVR